MVNRSYSPHGHDDRDKDFNICCGLTHSTTAARGFAVYFFVLCLVISSSNFFLFAASKTYFSIFCAFFTIHATVLLFGTFLEKRILLWPFLIFNGIFWLGLCVLQVLYAVLGTFTDAISEHHKENEPLRSLYKMHNLNPDDVNTQAVVSTSLLLFLALQLVIFGFGWLAVYRAYRCFLRRDTTMLPGYQKGEIAIDSPE